MKHSALGLGPFNLEDTVRCQVERTAPESGGGDSTAKDWDWNSAYSRNLASPWGGAHASAPDVARFFAEFLHPSGKALKTDTARLMVKNHNRDGITPHGLGFAVGERSGSTGCSEKTFGHSGATGTLAWADPATDTICTVITTLPLAPWIRTLPASHQAMSLGPRLDKVVCNVVLPSLIASLRSTLSNVRGSLQSPHQRAPRTAG